MTRLTGACAGLLAFSVAIFRGLSVGNTVEVILWRAIVALIVFCFMGLILGWMGKRIIVEYALNREKEMMARFQGTEEATEQDESDESTDDSLANSTPQDSEPIGA